MHKSKVIRTLRYLKSTELKRLLQFLKSPYFNSNKSIVKMYLLLRSEYPEFDSPKLIKEKVFKKIFPSRNYDHKKLQNLMVNFQSLLEKYLVILQLEKEKMEQQKLLLRAYAERPNCYRDFVKQTKVIHKELDVLPYRDDVYFLENKQLYLQYYGHPGTDMQKAGKESLELAVQNFETFSTIAGIKLKCAINAWENTNRDSITPVYSTKKIYNENAVLNIYTKLDQIQKVKEDHGELKTLTDYFISNIHLLRQEDQANILKILLNYCIRLVNKGKLEYTHISFTLYKIGLEQNCLLLKDKLTLQTFNNIISVSLYCNAFDWAKKFIDDYKKRLDPKIRTDALSDEFGKLVLQKGRI